MKSQVCREYTDFCTSLLKLIPLTIHIIWKMSNFDNLSYADDLAKESNLYFGSIFQQIIHGLREPQEWMA